MAAPDGIKWGSIYGSGTHQGRIGIIPIEKSKTNTEVTIEVQIWFWSEYNCNDSSNTLYYTRNLDATEAKTSRGSTSINNTATSQWSTSNQKKLAYSDTATYDRRTSSRTFKAYAKLTGIDYVDKAMYVNTTFTIPTLPKYTIAFNANGGSGAPASQTKWCGTALTLSSTKPTKTGHTFKGWATSASGSVAYAAGATIAAGTNSNLTLYAVWQANTYSVTYNANGGSGAPAAQTKTYGVALTLRGAPTGNKPNHIFKGWATSPTGAVAYKAGASYTANATVTLYAVWELAYVKPSVMDLTVKRSGTSAIVSFSWESFVAAPTIRIDWKVSSASSYGTPEEYTTSGTNGTFSKTLAYTSFSKDSTYTIRVTVDDGTDESFDVRSLPSNVYLLDFLRTKNGTAIGKIAETAELFDVGWLSRFRKDVMIGEKTGYLDGNQGVYLDAEGFVHLQRSTSQGHHPYLGFFLDDATETAGMIRLNSSNKNMEFVQAAAYSFGGNVVMPNNYSVQSLDTAGNRRAMVLTNASNNLIIGYGNFSNKNGNTHLCGNDALIYSAAAGDTGYRPYYRAGDSMGLTIHTSGYVTSRGTHVIFIIPLAKPIIGSPTVTITSGSGLTLRQGAKYTHGSAPNTYVKPTSYSWVGDTDWNAIIVRAIMSDTTNVTNNDAIGVAWNGTITFS